MALLAGPCAKGLGLSVPLFLVPAFAGRTLSMTASTSASILSGKSLASVVPQYLRQKAEQQPQNDGPRPDPELEAIRLRRKEMTASKKARLRRGKRNLALRAQRRDGNKQRGVSSLYGSGPRKETSVYKWDLPEPVIDAERRAQFKTAENHGLWGFFNKAKQPMVSGEDEAAFGRPWSYHELTAKDFHDLHRLYWTTILELNRTKTRQHEMRRVRAGYGNYEADTRIQALEETNANIRRVLADRHSAYSEAKALVSRVYLKDLGLTPDGLTECVLSGVLSVKGKKVLHVDRNDHYGGEAASVNIETLYRKYGNFKPGEEPWKKYGRANDWNIDLVPKLLMANGELTNILVSTDVTRYLEFKQIAGSFVQQGAGPRATVAKVPSTAAEALSSPLMGLFEKRRAKRFLEWVGSFDEHNPGTHNGININRATMKDVYDKFGLEPSTRDFIGHSMALFPTDDYLTTPGMALETITRIRLYANSMARYGKSPYIYPLFGLGDLPQGFARLSAIYGGTYMLNTTIDEIQYDASGKVSGISATMKERADEGEGMKFTTKTKTLLGDPSYFPGKVQVVGHLLKAICILTHPIEKTGDADSLQLIIPQSQVGRKNDIYIAMVSSAHSVCPKGYYIAIVSTIAETASNHHLELAPGLERLGRIEEIFTGKPIPIYEPLESGVNDHVYISKSYDASSHFESMTDDIRDIYLRATGEELKVQGLREGQTLAEE
ncbi:hypothetical protein DV737_g3062, partial [Chaetothyriales sp. CBS 132003]